MEQSDNHSLNQTINQYASYNGRRVDENDDSRGVDHLNDRQRVAPSYVTNLCPYVALFPLTDTDRLTDRQGQTECRKCVRYTHMNLLTQNLTAVLIVVVSDILETNPKKIP